MRAERAEALPKVGGRKEKTEGKGQLKRFLLLLMSLDPGAQNSTCSTYLPLYPLLCETGYSARE